MRRSEGAVRAARATSQPLALAAMMCAVAMTFIDQTIVSIAAPDIVSELHLSSTGMQWVVNAYLLALAAFFALGGRLADLFGPRRIVEIGTLVFVVSSVLCGCVPRAGSPLTWLVVFRATQGLGAALLFPAALAVVVTVFPVERRGRALALFFGLTGALTALGPLLGSWLIPWTWRAIFWINVPVAIVALVLTWLARIPTRRRGEPLDVPGAALIAAGMGLSVLGFQQAATWGWASAATWGCIAGGLAVLAVFCRYETRVRHPLIQLAVFRDRAFTVDVLVLFFAMLAFVPLFFFASVYAQISLSASPDQAALYLLYLFAGYALASQWGGRILDKQGARPTMKAGCVIGVVGFALWAGKLTDLSMHDQWPYAALAGAGIGFILAPASTDAVNRAIGASYGEVTGVTQTVRNFAASLGLALYGALLTHTMTDHVTDTLRARGLPAGAARSAARDVAEAVTGNPDARTPTGDGPLATTMRSAMSAIRRDFAEANQWVLYGMAIALALGYLCALRHPGGRTPGTTPDAASDTTSATSPQAPASPSAQPPAQAYGTGRGPDAPAHGPSNAPPRHRER